MAADIRIDRHLPWRALGPASLDYLPWRFNNAEQATVGESLEACLIDNLVRLNSLRRRYSA